MAWPSNRRERRALREALGFDRRVGQYYVPAPPGGWIAPEHNQPIMSQSMGPEPGITPQGQPPMQGGCPPGTVIDLVNETCIPEGLGECELIERYTPGCPVFPGELKYIAQTVTIGAASTGEFEFDTPGIFCPQRMLIFSDDVELMFVTRISSGVRNQIIEGFVSAEIFSTANTCCPLSCLDCLCAPGMNLNVTILNTDVTPEDVTVVIIGTYYNIPPGMTPKEASKNLPLNFPGCPVPGQDKIVGAGVTTSGTTAELIIETPGRFCPRQLYFTFISNTFTLANVFVNSIETSTENQLIDSRVPATLWSVQNDCCILSCFKCLCMPGVPLKIKVDLPDDESPQTILAAVIGSYEDAC